jgi:hypothetical protein
MNILRKIRATEAPEADGKLGFGTDERVRLDAPEDMTAVRVLVHVLQDEPDKARAVVRVMSPRDRALLSFVLSEVTDMLDAAETARRVDADTRTRALVRGEDPDE